MNPFECLSLPASLADIVGPRGGTRYPAESTYIGTVPHMYTLCYSSDSDNENNHWRQNGDWDSDTGTLSDDSCDADDEWEDAGGDDGEDKWEYDEDDVFQTITRPAIE